MSPLEKLEQSLRIDPDTLLQAVKDFIKAADPPMHGRYCGYDSNALFGHKCGHGCAVGAYWEAREVLDMWLDEQER